MNVNSPYYVKKTRLLPGSELKYMYGNCWNDKFTLKYFLIAMVLSNYAISLLLQFDFIIFLRIRSIREV